MLDYLLSTSPDHLKAAAVDTLLDRLLDYLDSRFGVDALWVFGSEANGRARPGSDLDVAVLFRARPSPAELIDARAEAGLLLGRTVDLVDLDSASPILAMQVLRRGRLVADRNPVRRIRFAAAAPGRSEDVRIMQRPIRRRLLERLQHG